MFANIFKSVLVMSYFSDFSKLNNFEYEIIMKMKWQKYFKIIK